MLVENNAKGKFLEAKCNYFLYTVYTFFEDFDKCRYYAFKTLETANIAGEKNLVASAYAALGTTYTFRYDSEKNSQDIDSIMYYTKMAGDMYLQYPGKVADYTYYMARLNTVSYRLKYFYPTNPNIAGGIIDSVESILQVLNKNVGYGKENIMANCYGMMASIAKDRGQYIQAESYLSIALDKINSAKSPLYYARNNILIEMSNVYAAQGNYKKAFETQNDLFMNNAKLFDEKRVKMVNQLEAQYQAEKKERELQVLKDQAKSQRRMQYLYLGLAIIGSIGVFFMFRSYHFNLKYSMEHQKKLEAQQHDAQLRILLQEEEQARLKAERELMELQQQKLRDEVMMSQLQVQHKNEVLQNLKEKLDDKSTVNIQQIIREENILDNDFENAKFRIQEIHPNFFKNLNEISGSKLTTLDMKYCAYIYLSMDTKQIAHLLNVEPKSVRMAKYRLKQKFNLEKETDLTGFLKGIA